LTDRDEPDFSNLLHFDPRNGRISLKDYRMVLFSACALGALRKELIETLGWERARGLLKRFGYAAGIADGKSLAERFPKASADQQMAFGPMLHALEGAARVAPIASRSRIDLDNGVYHVEAYWRDSYEAEQHLAELGRAGEPVCWNLAGYATGHSTVAAGRPTLAIERECRAMGHDHCRFVVDFAENFDEAFDCERGDYEALHLPEVLRELKETIERQRDRLEQKERALAELSVSVGQRENLGGMMGESPALLRALDLAQRAAPVDSTILILGESGTGKELLARGIHRRSRRADQPFLPVNCSALPETMQEAELFGYAKGAFTGAATARPGVFESAHGGTLFLDEIGDLSLTAQTKILRALQEGEVKRLGENRPRQVDVRILAATHRDLAEMVRDRTFREDLFYRLDVVPIRLPPLRERENDALLLARHFVGEFGKKFGKKTVDLSNEALRRIAAYPWPGNVRELRHAMERAVILAAGPRVGVEDLPDKLRGNPSPPSPRHAPSAAPGLALLGSERERIQEALRQTHGRRAAAARLLGVSRATLWRRMKALDID